MSERSQQYHNWAKDLSDGDLDREWNEGTVEQGRLLGKDPTSQAADEHQAKMKALDDERKKRRF